MPLKQREKLAQNLRLRFMTPAYSLAQQAPQAVERAPRRITNFILDAQPELRQRCIRCV